LTPSPSVKATANTNGVKRDERVNQDMIKVVPGKAGLGIKMAEQQPRFQHTNGNIYNDRVRMEHLP
jgi:hypothetical protein